MLLDTTYLLISFKKPQKRSKVENLLEQSKIGLVLEDAKQVTESGLEDQRLRINHTTTDFWVATPEHTAITDEQIKMLGSKEWKARLVWIGPVYRLAHIQGLKGMLCPLPTALFVKLGKAVRKSKIPDQKRLTIYLGRSTVKSLNKQSLYRSGYWYAELKHMAEKSVYNLQRELITFYKSGKKRALVEKADFDVMPMVKTASASHIYDPMYGSQWNLHRINADAGWAVTRGGGVKVVVVDYGCELGHPDLNQRFNSRGISLEDQSQPGACPNGESHGTACAGILGASINNKHRGQYEGIAGIAGECELIPVAIVRGTTSEIKDALEYALDQNADVISFSHDDPGWESETLNSEIAKAAESIVICAAAGNGSANSLSYPAKHPGVMACGAVNKDPTNSAREKRRPSSNYGSGLSVVAPGNNIPTTFNTGDGTAGRNYEYGFLSGTSSATPHVAGLAALLISAYPNDLRNNSQEVRRIIEESAEELPDYSYTDMTKDPNGIKGWESETGFGLININRAFSQAGNEFGTGTL